jgi:hypothetical protein
LTKVLRAGSPRGNRVGLKLAPSVPVQTLAGEIRSFGKRPDVSDFSRAALAAAKRLELSYEGSLYKLKENTVDVGVDVTVEKDLESTTHMRAATLQVALATAAIDDNLELRIATVVRNPANYPAGCAEVVTDKFDDPASDVFELFDDAAELIRTGEAGMKPNVAWFSGACWAGLRRNSKFANDVIKDRTRLTDDDLPAVAAALNVKEVVICDTNVSIDGVGTDIYGNDAGLLYVAPQAPGFESPEVPSFAYTYTMEDHPYVREAYESEDKRTVFYGVERFDSPVVSCSAAGVLFRNAV